MQQHRSSVYKYGEKMDVMISTLNPISKTLPLNSARVILRNIFLSISQRQNKHAEEMLKEITQN